MTVDLEVIGQLVVWSWALGMVALYIITPLVALLADWIQST